MRSRHKSVTRRRHWGRRSSNVTIRYALLVALLAAGCSPAPAPPPATPAPARKVVEELPPLTEASASNFAQLTLKCVQKTYPNQPGLILDKPSDVLPPEKAHPSFYGCYDWHSSVHGHWMLARLLRLFPSLPERAQIVTALDANLTPENIQTEAAYYKRPGTQAFERTYGWAWTLKLAEELLQSSAPEAKAWSTNLTPLADTLAARVLAVEHRLYPRALALFASGGISISGDKVSGPQVLVNQEKVLIWPPLD